jgi:hypothetical protein
MICQLQQCSGVFGCNVFGLLEGGSKSLRGIADVSNGCGGEDQHWTIVPEIATRT